MALQHKTSELIQSLDAHSPNYNYLRRQLEMISWLPTEESSQAQVNRSGLRRVLEMLSSDNKFPDYLRLEASRFLARWGRGLYGPPYCSKKIRSTAPGNHGFVVGDCWPNRKTVFNEGCHGTFQSGIHGDNDYGAFSIVANGVYDNRDQGDTIWYAGTNPTNPGEATLYTQRLITSHDTGNPVRVIRGAKGAGLTMEPLSPARGFRYDGLYTVKEYGPPAPVNGLKPPAGTYEFLLERNDGQPPILYKDADMKPDNETLAQWHVRKLYDRPNSRGF
ncbi:hypothetical protein Q9L58_001000 [Maublancomyces gigas]|uniref:YDG domain-containing protein n=1 Tax=Discina gigas TaxID=1032678 RepID=A0ABR3GVI7_9PEZI